MDQKERIKLVAPCGIDCGICEAYTCRDNTKIFEYLVSRGIPASKLPCNGCRAIDGDCPTIGSKCETYICVSNKNKEYCFQCSDYPCTMLLPAADRAEILPHNLKVFQLSMIEKHGVEHFLKESPALKLRYYKGKMMVGKGPQL